MRKRAHTPKQRMTAEYNVTLAEMKVGTGDLKRMTDANLESIARSHCGGRPGAYERLLERLRTLRAERQAREAAHG